MIWKIVALACMINNPDNCWEWVSPKDYASYAECQHVLASPYVYGYTEEWPTKVEGAKWTIGPDCIARIK